MKILIAIVLLAAISLPSVAQTKPPEDAPPPVSVNPSRPR